MKKISTLFIVLIFGLSFFIHGLNATFATTDATNDGPTKSWTEVASEAYWYSRYYLGNVVMMSGMGLHMVFNPTFQGDLMMMMDKISTASNLTHGSPPMNAWPIFAEFASATPKFAQPLASNTDTDYMTLRWNLDGADTDLYPAVLAQVGLKNIIWSEDFFRVNHFIANGSETTLAPDTVPNLDASDSGATIALGKGPTSSTDMNTQGFRGFVLTAEVINKMKLLKGILAVNISSGTLDMGLDPMTNAADYYFPHRYTYDINMVIPVGAPMAMPKPENYSVVDSSSTLWDQLSLLWMSSRFFGWSSNNDQNDVFGGNGMGAQPFPGPMSETSMAGPEDLSKGLANTIWMALKSHHWNSTAKSFVDTATYNSGSLTTGTAITTVNAGLTITALEEWSKVTKNGMGQNVYITDQADFLITNLQSADGGFSTSYDLATGSASTSARTLETQAAAIRGLLSAYQVSNDNKYKTAALNTFDFIENHLWDDNNGVYKSAEDATTYTFDPKSVGVVVGALREILALGDSKTKPLAHYRLLQFFENAVDKSGFQQAEIAPTGGQDDNDDIPAPPMQTANGATNGTAPVPAGQVQFDTTSSQWSVTDYTFYTDKAFYAANEFMWTGMRQTFFDSYTSPTETYIEAVNNYYLPQISSAQSSSTSAGSGSETSSDTVATPGFELFILAQFFVAVGILRKIGMSRLRRK